MCKWDSDFSIDMNALTTDCNIIRQILMRLPWFNKRDMTQKKRRD